MRSSSKVILTREEEDIKKDRKLFESQGFEVIELPLIRTLPLPVELPLQDYDYIVFQSQKAVKYFFERWKPSPKARIIAVGEKTVKLLKELGYEVFKLPEKQSAEGLIEIFKNLPEGQVLIPKSKIGRRELIEFLRKRGFQVYELDLYTTEPVLYRKEEFLSRLKEGNFILFYSPSAVNAFFANLQKNGIALEEVELRFIAVGETTKRALQDKGIDDVLTPEKPSTEAVINLLKKLA
ncbi:uroporphyrinogen-III synthase [Aquifex sp.]